jgi:hypothetical protein
MKRNGVRAPSIFGRLVVLNDCPVTVSLRVDGIAPVMWNKLAYERLIISPKTKELVEASVSKNYSNYSNYSSNYSYSKSRV